MPPKRATRATAAAAAAKKTTPAAKATAVKKPAAKKATAAATKKATAAKATKAAAPTKKAAAAKKAAPAAKAPAAGKKRAAAGAATTAAADPPAAKKGKTTAAPAATGVRPSPAKVDDYQNAGTHHVPEVNGVVWDAMLNQTNIGANNNKFYVIQLLAPKKKGGNFYTWTKWGRVGAASPADARLGPFKTMEEAQAEFEKKFKAKTSNNWSAVQDGTFKFKSGKYDFVKIIYDDVDMADVQAKLDAKHDGKAAPAPVAAKHKDSKLDTQTQKLVSLIFDEKMFQNHMADFDVDLTKLPVMNLDKEQIKRGADVLLDLRKMLSAKTKPAQSKLTELTSHFYTIIPHSFGMRRPPVLDSMEAVDKKIELMEVLGDIEVAAGKLKAIKKKGAAKSSGSVPHPLDTKYDTLGIELVSLAKGTDEHSMIQQYMSNTNEGSWYKGQVVDAWRVDRPEEPQFMKKHAKLERRLLWHGSSISAYVSILSGGLKIMPYSGGRVGRGIYFADMFSKSAGYTQRGQDGCGLMMLVDVAVGDHHPIQRDDSSLRKAPGKAHSVLARGTHMPDPKGYMKRDDGLIVPWSKPTKTNISSSFSDNEWLIYDASQHLIRYLIKVRF